ncbi:multidrug ABC transporter ATP-binding protein [Cellulomonas hominis]|uniref:Multidrug ABC transporter ATP-binding protein n=1 Tax=Cellulomonas hominis TaxID=156981 RepID=A0A511FGZ1_9CELL|nr:ABC transporter ATP-binding protein [Cellulomonas hominis]NKY06844.1 ABC transporter ATP-binding protein [Cellulomonas hominis]NKY09208.1 ABC transporter ATP-binding protein [Cellulomonas hominis]GEL47118.1 multidrug ABC transporter ATP-binding protein [Cellulomonas hominis]
MLARLLWRYLRPYRWLLAGVLVFQLCSALAMLYLPSLNADIVDQGVARGDTGYIWRTGAFMLTVSLGQILAAIAATYCAARAAMQAGRDIRDDVYERVSGFSEREISRFGAGSLITRNTNDVQQVQMLAMMGATMLVSAPMLAIGGIVMALRQDVGLSWLIAVSVPVLLVIAALIIGRMVPLFRSYQGKLDAVNRIMREQLTGVRVVRAFVREDIESERFGVANTDIMVVGRKIGSLFVVLFPLAMLVLNVTVVGVIWFGGIEVDAGNVQIGTLLAFMQYIGQILMGVLMATFMTVMIPRAAVSAERISEVLGSRSTLAEAADPVREATRPGEVAFEDVTFAYPEAEHPVLSGLTFTARPGQTLAVIGSTGSGKTTLVSLIPRLFDATGGTVRVGGTDVRDAELESLWSGIGLVPQRPFLFAGTVASNLRLGQEDATDADLWQALEIAQASDFVAQMDGGLEARIAQGGTNVSGGQRQRLAIARALVRRPPVLVFDDSFSALDLATDARLRQALWRELPEVTKIVVAQRVSTVTDADQILVLEDGRVAGLGTHAELLAGNQTYREIAESQLSVEAGR